MIRKLRSLLILMFTIVLTSCVNVGKPDGIGMSTEEGAIFPSFVDEKWQDNSMDSYSAEFIRALNYTEQKDAIYGGAEQYILGKDIAVVFKKHLFQEVDRRWDEIKIFTEKGDENSLRLNFWADRSNQAWVIGSFWDSKHYMMMDMEKDENKDILYRFFETDESMQVLRQFYIEGFDKKENEFPRQILVDADGNIHVTTYRNSDDVQRYCVISTDGTSLVELCMEKSLKSEMKLFYLYDGRVGLQIGKKLLVTDKNLKRTDALVEMTQECMACTLWDDHTLVYADGEGLHQSNLSGNEKETIYLWKNHGIRCSKIVDLRISENHDISLLYAAQEAVYYMKLVPTLEEVQMINIQFAVSASTMKKFQTAVMEFNRKNPTWHIDLEEYERNDTKLLTKLVAGDGPQLIDSFLVGFEDQIDLWEPLDRFYNQIDFQLIPEVLELGNINGKPYGVVTDFGIDTMITFAKSPTEWDYKAFLDCLMKGDMNQKSVYNTINGSDGFAFISLFFHDLTESFLYDADNCSTSFDSADFQRILQLALNYENIMNQATEEDFLQGNSLCAVVEIRKPEDLAGIRIIGKDKIRYIGFPSQTGSVNYLMGSDPLCIRANATEEEKQLAFAFLKFLLSDEGQELVNDGIFGQWSVREDLVEGQFQELDDTVVSNLIGFSPISITGHLDSNGDFETFHALLKKAKPKRYAPVELRKILMEEMAAYLEGSIPEYELKKNLTDRVALYLKEQK